MLIAGLSLALCACGGPTSEKAEGNPFFSDFDTPFGVPPFELITPEHYKAAFLQGIDDHVQEVEAIVNQRSMPDFDNTIAALDQSGALLSKVSYVFFAQEGANTNEQLQNLSSEMAPLLAQHSDDINLNPRLFARVKEVYERRADFNLDKEQEKLLENTYRNFIRGGADLPEEKQEKLRMLNGELAVLELTFEQNLLEETNAYRLVIDDAKDLAGLPDGLVQAAAAKAKEEGKEGKWVFTLQNASVMPFLQYADNRDLREQIFKAYTNRCNNGNKADNKEVVRQLVTKRLEKAKLLGYEDYAEYVLEERMAKHADKVYGLMDQLWRPALKMAKAELADIQAEIRKSGKDFEAEAWDWRYYFEKAKKAKFNLDENEVRPYLPLDSVRKGVFYVANQLYGVTFTPVEKIPLPHPDAVAFECKDKDGTHLGVLYMDFYARASKAGGAWCTAYRPELVVEGKRQAPVVTVVYNFSKPAAGEQALLNADEACTVFHEFGHALHNLFERVHYYGVADVPRDFVELPSQVLEHWTFEPEVLKVFAKHYQTNEEIPAALVEKLEKSGKYGQGFSTVEFLAAALLDMDYHVLTEIPAGFDVEQFEAQTLAQRGLIRQIPPRYRSTYFSHTMGGGYTAGYYGYIWAEVLDADAFQAFKQSGDIFHPELAARFRQHVLTPGGVNDAMDMYKAFRGHEPSTDALLKNRGLK